MSQTASRTLWEQGREPGRDVVALGVALAFTVACLDLTMTGRIGGVFDVGFVMVSIAIALLSGRATSSRSACCHLC